MNFGKFLLVSLAGGITLFILGFLLYGLLMGGMEDADTSMGWRTQPLFGYIFFMNWTAAILLTLVMSQWGRVTGFAAGAGVGALFGLLWSLSWAFGMMAFRTDANWGEYWVSLLIDAFMFAVAGGVIALLNERMGAKAAT